MARARGILNRYGEPMSQSFPPRRELGVAGYAVYGGYVDHREKDGSLRGEQRWRTFSDIATNTSIVAAGLRMFLELVASVDWAVEPAEEGAEDDPAALFVERAMDEMDTGWARFVRRLALYRFYGYSIHEWTATRRDDGAVNFADIEVRPCWTIEQWWPDERGTITGVTQRSPQTGASIDIPRGKLVYLVDDTLSDNPEGIGIFRHVAEPAERLDRYLSLETIGYQRNFRGLPVGRAPLNQLATNPNFTEAEKVQMLAGFREFVEKQVNDESTSIVIDSTPYSAKTNDGVTYSTTPLWGIELLSGSSSMGVEAMGKAIDRLNREMARIIGVEQLMLGDGGGGNRALSEDKSRNLYMIANATLRDIAEALNRDFIGPLWRLNGFRDEDRPKLKPAQIDMRSAEGIAATLRDMATAGATIRPDDPVIDDVRDIMGVSRQPEFDPLLDMPPGSEDDDDIGSDDAADDDDAAARRREAADDNLEDA